MSPDEVHLWSMSLRASCTAVARAQAMLSVTERGRLLKVLDPLRRKRLTIARATVRVVLGRYLDIDPERVPLTRTATGKPAIGGGRKTPAFNVSHSGELVVVAVTNRAMVGVDIEQLGLRSRADGLIDRVLSSSEASAVRGLTGAEQELALLTHWTAKEAYLKALGSGWDRDPRTLEVAALTAPAGPGDSSGSFTLQRFDPGPGMVGTVAATGGPWHAVSRSLGAGYFG